ncbi:MAG: hypothetical protein SFV17_15940 [Candidatus Obscuribacter sp.]|nr:hypothetical protein [Candidatus Obscuribacter sp.]
MFSNQKKLLDSVSIAAPCPIKWSEMEGNATVRHCASCKLNVYNISQMNRDEAETFLSKATGEICLQLYRRRDGTLITRDCPTGIRLRDRLNFRLKSAAAVLVALFNTVAAFAQNQAPNPLSPEVGRIEGPRNKEIFTIEVTASGGRYYTSGKREKESLDKYKESAKLEQTDTLKSGKADTKALDAYTAAKLAEKEKKLAEALSCYERSIAAFRNSPGTFDPGFASQVAKSYGKLLRKTKNPEKAKLIEREFYRFKER